MPTLDTSENAMHAQDMKSVQDRLSSAQFLYNHTRFYSSLGKMGSPEGLIWSMTGEPCDGGEGDARHFMEVSRVLTLLAEEIAACEREIHAAAADVR
jgi:hypothetical protein